MAESFQPRFVDLVRNYTSTSGTGNLVLDAAAPGFKSFVDALQTGDSFYYSVAGIDKPAETEVGRGTLLADGSIARQPLGGAATDFATGKKTVALVAAAEWFGRIEAASRSATWAADRTALAALDPSGPVFLAEPGREGLFLFNGSDLSAQVAADGAQGLYIAPASVIDGSSGAWIRQFDGAVDPTWFGVLEGDNSANGAANSAAMTALLQAIAAAGHSSVRFPGGIFWFASTIELSTGRITLEGPASMGGDGAELKFPTGVTGIRVHGPLTSGASTKDLAAHASAAGSQIRHLTLRGAFSTSGIEAEAHGIQLRDDARIENLLITRFEGDGIHAAASTGAASGASPPYGNVNKSFLADVTVSQCRNGIFFDGTDANACTVIAPNCTSNRQWGIWDSSFLGNTYVGGHTSDNGRLADNDGVDIPVSIVTDGTNRYFCVAGQEPGASTNAPSGTTADNLWWAYWGPGGTGEGIATWSSGVAVRAGGSVHADSVNAHNVFDGLYAEGGQAPAQLSQNSLVLGGVLAGQIYLGNRTAGAAPCYVSTGSNGVLLLGPWVQAQSGTVTTTFGGGSGNIDKNVLTFNEPAQAPESHKFRYAGGNLRLTYGSGTRVFDVTGPATAEQFGTGAVVSEAFFAEKLMIGDTIANARRIANGAAAPTTGVHGQGEWVFYRGASPNLIGFSCLAAGTPGTWQSHYGLSQLQVAGSGLTTSATDRLLGRSSAGAGAVEEIICTAAGRALLDDADAAAQRATLGVKRGLAFHCAGVPLSSEVIGGGIAPQAVTLSPGNSTCKALAAATAAVTLPIKKNGVQVGQIDFPAGGTAGTVTLTNATIAAGDQITVHNAAAADATLGDIDGLLVE